MKKKVEKEKSVKEIGVPPVSTGHPPEISGEKCESKECKKIAKLTITFQNEDFNKVVEKINEIIEHDTL